MGKEKTEYEIFRKFKIFYLSEDGLLKEPKAFSSYTEELEFYEYETEEEAEKAILESEVFKTFIILETTVKNIKYD